MADLSSFALCRLFRHTHSLSFYFAFDTQNEVNLIKFWGYFVNSLKALSLTNAGAVSLEELIIGI